MARQTFSIKIEDFTDDVMRAVEEQIPLALKGIGVTASTYAQEDCPVDTGRLHNSIAWATSDASGGGDDGKRGDNKDGPSNPNGTPEVGTVYIGSNVEYAEEVEFGNHKHKVGKKHFLRDALKDHADEWQQHLEAALKS